MAQFTFDQVFTLGLAPSGNATLPATPANNTQPPANTGSTVGPAPAATQGGAVIGAESKPATPPNQTATTQAGNPILGFLGTFGPMILIFVLLYFVLFHGQRKEEKKRKAMIAEMKKGDEVMTIGGLVGKVHDIKDDRVVIKIDEANNVKATYLKTAIQRVLRDEDK